jgi:hypothetical protein
MIKTLFVGDAQQRLRASATWRRSLQNALASAARTAFCKKTGLQELMHAS